MCLTVIGITSDLKLVTANLHVHCRGSLYYWLFVNDLLVYAERTCARVFIKEIKLIEFYHV